MKNPARPLAQLAAVKERFLKFCFLFFASTLFSSHYGSPKHSDLDKVCNYLKYGKRGHYHALRTQFRLLRALQAGHIMSTPESGTDLELSKEHVHPSSGPSSPTKSESPVGASPSPPLEEKGQEAAKPQPQARWLSVSQSFKKTCYRCGNLGHQAEECQFDGRLCYNCKEPGHESSKCPHGRSAKQKQCYYCKQIGHIQTQCPELEARTAARQPRRQSRQRAPTEHDQIKTQNLMYYSQLRQHQQDMLLQQQQQFYHPMHQAPQFIPYQQHQRHQQHHHGAYHQFIPQPHYAPHPGAQPFLPQSYLAPISTMVPLMHNYGQLPGPRQSFCYKCGTSGHKGKECPYGH